MKKLVILLFLFISCEFAHAPLKQEKKQELIETYADFKEAYLHIRKWEGNWGHYKEDPGGVTYAGIARKYNKSWRGWIVYDQWIKNNQPKHNQYIEELEFWALDYYLTIWLKEGYDKIKDQKLATYLFDYRNSGPIAYVHTRRVLVGMGYIIHPDGLIDERLINVLNNVNTEQFLKKLQDMRMKYYVRTAQKHPHQIMFLSGWLNRTYDV